MDGRRSGWSSQWMTSAVDDRRNGWPDDYDDNYDLIASPLKTDDTVKIITIINARCYTSVVKFFFAPPHHQPRIT